MRIISIFSLLPGIVSSFTLLINAPRIRQSSELFLEDRIANMIDRELYRANHKKEFENEWMEKNRGAVLSSLNQEETTVTDTDSAFEFRQQAKDRKLAKNDPAAYCADRCVTTGNCDVYEDIFKFSPTEVMEFCNDCVLSDEEEPCDIPEAFFDWDDEKGTMGNLHP